MSRRTRPITLVLDPDSPDAEVVLAAAYNLACCLAADKRHAYLVRLVAGLTAIVRGQ